MKEVMFICTKNSIRSQMAEGLAKTLGKEQISVTSCGLEPSSVNPQAIAVMAEIGIDISQQTSKSINNFQAEDYDVVISLCGCGVNLPQEWIFREVFEDWQLNDPKDKPIEDFRQVRDEIKERVIKLIENISN